MPVLRKASAVSLKGPQSPCSSKLRWLWGRQPFSRWPQGHCPCRSKQSKDIARRQRSYARPFPNWLRLPLKQCPGRDKVKQREEQAIEDHIALQNMLEHQEASKAGSAETVRTAKRALSWS